MILLPACAARAEAPLVILLSWDGVRPDWLERGSFPALERMRRDGSRARLVPVFPTNTFPNQVALATGTYVDRHGIAGNVFHDRERGLFRYSDDASWIEAEPLWIAAERQGVRSAVFYWVGSQTDWQGRRATLRKAPFAAETPESAKVDQILAWLDGPEAARPRLIMSWWHGCDGVAHRWGPDHAAVAVQLAAQDRELARLLAGIDARRLWKRTTLLVVSDHGMASVSAALDPLARLASRGIEARLVPAGGTAHLYLEDVRQVPAARATLGADRRLQVFTRGSLPERLRAGHPRRSGDLILLSRPPWTFFAARPDDEPADVAAKPNPGGHGYDPRLPEMRALFLSLGRGIRAGHDAGDARIIDVASTVAALLRIDPPLHSEGRPLPILEPAPR